MKPMYSHALVELSLELHIPPKNLYEQQFKLRHRDTPIIELIWETYAGNPRKLNKDAKKLRSMEGFGQPKKFYDGVQVKETFERDFSPMADYPDLKPIMLVMILDLYFRLTPITMAEETPEVQDLAKLMKIKPQLVVEVMDVFQLCDPYLNRDDLMISSLLLPCREIWDRYGNDNPEKLSSFAAQLKEYFR